MSWGRFGELGLQVQEWAEDPRILGGAEDRSPRQDRKGVAGPWQSCGCDLGAGHNRALETSRSHFREREPATRKQRWTVVRGNEDREHSQPL